MTPYATKITTQTKDGKTIISVEKIFGFLCDSNSDRQAEIRHEDEVSRLSRGFSPLNLN